MKCAVLYGKESGQHQHLIEGAKEHFDTVLGAPLENVKIVYDDGETRLMYKNTDLCEFDCVFLRFLGDDLMYGEHFPEILEDHGVYTQLDVDSLSIASNKFYMMKVLADAGLPVPPTTYTLSTEQTEHAAEELGYPCVIKIISGYGGKGVMKADSESDLRPIIDTLTLFEQDICLQAFIENPGEDIRVMVIGDETYSYKRVSEGDEFRSNISAGGNVQQYEPRDEIKEAAVRTAKLCGFDFCGIDVIEDEETGDFYIGEINASPGIEDGEDKIGTDMVEAVMSYVKQKTIEKQSEEGV